MPPLRRLLCALLGVAVIGALLSPVTSSGAAERIAPGIRYESTSTGSARDSSSLTVSRPGGVTTGDVLVARIANRDAVDATLSAPGWIAAGSTHSAAMLKSWVVYRVVTASEPSSYTFSQDASTGLVASISAYRGVDRADPVDDFSGRVNGRTAAFVAPTATSTKGNDVAVWYGTQVWSGSDCPVSGITAPSGFVEPEDECLDSDAGLIFDTAYRQLGAAGPQPTTVMAPAVQSSWTGSSVFATTNLTQVLLLRPAGEVEVADRYSAGTVKVGSFSVPDDVLHEPSGLAVSRVNAGVIYTHSEIDDKTMVAISADDASVLARFTLSNPGQWDWEDIATGPCPAGSCIYVGDIGGAKAGARRENSYNIFRVAEPTVVAGQEDALTTERYRFSYPDGAHNAEALLVHPDSGDVYVVTKEPSGRSGVYTFPEGLPAPSSTTVTTLTKVATLQLPTYTPADSSASELHKAIWYPQVTAGAIHPAGNRFILRTPYAVWEYRGTEGGSFESALNATPVALTAPLGEGQGEAIDYALDGSAYYTLSERTAPPYTLHRIDRR
jgi:hypothetical protein